MADRANVTSIEALEFFRVSLILYLGKAGKALDEIADEVRRTKQWLENDQRTHWENQRRRRYRALEQAEQELYSATISGMHRADASKKLVVRRAKAALDEAENKLRILKKWRLNFDNAVDPRTRKVESLRYLLSHDMSKAVAFLNNSLKSLEEYAELTPASAGGPEGAKKRADETGEADESAEPENENRDDPGKEGEES